MTLTRPLPLTIERDSLERQKRDGAGFASVFDEAEGGQLPDQLAVQGGLGVEVEILQSPGAGREAKRRRLLRRRSSVAFLLVFGEVAAEATPTAVAFESVGLCSGGGRNL